MALEGVQTSIRAGMGLCEVWGGAMIYLIGSLRNPEIPNIANRLREGTGEEVFASWFAAGEIADDRWQAYEKSRGLTYQQALKDYAAQNALSFDKAHLNRCTAAVLVYPAGKSGHTELGYVLGQEKPAFVLLDQEPTDRWDVMLGLATDVCLSIEEVIEALHRVRSIKR